MTFEDKVQALRTLGYSPKQSYFLVEAALFSGCFVRRQFRAGYGNEAHRLIQKVMNKGHATSRQFTKRTHLYHLDAYPFYAAIGEANNPNRFAKDSYQIIARLMALDYLLLNRQLHNLRTRQERFEYFGETRRIAKDLIPPYDKSPISVTDSGQVTFAYVDAGKYKHLTFAKWLRRYAPLFRALGSAETVIVSTPLSERIPAAAEIARVFPSAATLPEEVVRYCRTREGIESGRILDPTNFLLPAYARQASHVATVEELAAHYAVWREPGCTVTSSVFLLPFTYKMLGTHGQERADAA
jgi:hypothetical protein